MLAILQGDAIEQLRTLPDESVHCCVTSPPYWGLRDYGTNRQLGLEKTPQEYVAKMVEVFREVRCVLRKDGTLWLNLGDSYAGGTQTGRNDNGRPEKGRGWAEYDIPRTKIERCDGLKPKDLCGIPWRVAFALQADGWWLRSDIIWAKPNPMPESVTDRPTKAHEYLFLLTKSANYFYDAEAIKEANSYTSHPGRNDGADSPVRSQLIGKANNNGQGGLGACNRSESGRNKRSVWTVTTAPYPEAHFATYPPDLIKPCILAGTSAKGCCAKCGSPWERVVENKPMVINRSERTHKLGRTRSSGTMLEPAESKTIGWQPTCKCADAPFVPISCTVLDPFAGSGTTGAVALELGRKGILIELNPKYIGLIKTRCNITPGLQLA